jgi:hypothetical protein
MTTKQNQMTMTKSILKLSLLGLIAAAVAAPMHLCAQNTNAPWTEKKEAKPKRSTLPPLHGNLKAVDSAAKTLTVGEHTVQITSETKMVKTGQPATLADGVVGEEVTINYRKTDAGKLEALMVRFGPKEGKTEAKKEKKELKRELKHDDMTK